MRYGVGLWIALAGAGSKDPGVFAARCPWGCCFQALGGLGLELGADAIEGDPGRPCAGDSPGHALAYAHGLMGKGITGLLTEQ